LSDTRHDADVRLAQRCGAGDREAIAELERRILELDAVIVGLVHDRGLADDVKQTLREKLLVGDSPRILQYAGRGDLRAWLRVAATREALTLLRRSHKAGLGSPEEVENLAAPITDPALSHLRRRHGQDFKNAFRDAAARLDTRERLMLRHYYIEKLTIDEIGDRYKIHRVTAMRRVERARERLVASVRFLLMERLSITPHTLDSILGDLDGEMISGVREALEATSS